MMQIHRGRYGEHSPWESGSDESDGTDEEAHSLDSNRVAGIRAHRMHAHAGKGSLMQSANILSKLQDTRQYIDELVRKRH
jgi:hypothetical protein